jgi:hypothetical protein
VDEEKSHFKEYISFELSQRGVASSKRVEREMRSPSLKGGRLPYVEDRDCS